MKKYGIFGQISCKIQAFCWLFIHIFSGKNVLHPNLTEVLRLRNGRGSLGRRSYVLWVNCVFHGSRKMTHFHLWCVEWTAIEVRWAGVGLQNADETEKRRQMLWWDGQQGIEVTGREESGTLSWRSASYVVDKVYWVKLTSIDLRSRLVVGPSQWLVRFPRSHYLTVSVSRRVMTTFQTALSNIHWKHYSLVDIDVPRAVEVFTTVRYINLHLLNLLTYLGLLRLLYISFISHDVRRGYWATLCHAHAIWYFSLYDCHVTSDNATGV